MAPRHCDPVVLEVLPRLAPHHRLDRVRGLGEPLVVALAGPTSCASPALPCPTCLTRPLSHGHPRSSHPALPPVVGCPRRSQVMAFPPAYILPPAGHDTQDSAQMAGQRGRRHQAHAIAPPHVTLLGDDLDSQPPWWACARAKGCKCIVVCQPASPPQLDARVAFWHANDGSAAGARRHWQGRCTAVALDRFLPDVLLLDGQEALAVHWCAIPVRNAKTGEHLSPNSCLTHHQGTADTVAEAAQAGRGRWKIAHENPQGLTTQGDHVAPNFGPGQPSRAALLLSRNRLALLCPTVWEWSAAPYALLRQARARRQTFGDAIRALRRSMVFDRWQHRRECMSRGLELASRLEPQSAPKLDTS
jgi:hypothetical protein